MFYQWGCKQNRCDYALSNFSRAGSWVCFDQSHHLSRRLCCKHPKDLPWFLSRFLFFHGSEQSNSRAESCSYPMIFCWLSLSFQGAHRQLRGTLHIVALSTKFQSVKFWGILRVPGFCWSCLQSSCSSRTFRWRLRCSLGFFGGLLFCSRSPMPRKLQGHDGPWWHFDIFSHSSWVWRPLSTICWWQPCPTSLMYLWFLNFDVKVHKRSVWIGVSSLATTGSTTAGWLLDF